LLRLCLERGYDQIEIPDLLERAELPESAFRRHFSDLEDCFCAKLEDERELFFAAVNRTLRGQALWVDRLAPPPTPCCASSRPTHAAVTSSPPS
jgi:AcrR family transcriptional regulator